MEFANRVWGSSLSIKVCELSSSIAVVSNKQNGIENRPERIAREQERITKGGGRER